MPTDEGQAEAVALAHQMGYADGSAAARAKVERLETRIAELEATGPERDLAERALGTLEWLAQRHGDIRVWDGLDRLTVIVHGDDEPYYLYQHVADAQATDITRAEALALLEKGAKE